jgi:small redox-active disulfide protein 2
LNIKYELEHIHDLNKIADFGVIGTPGLVVDGEVKITGKVPSLDEIKKMLQ